MRTAVKIADELVAGVRNGGATVPVHHGGVVPQSGYVVATVGHEHRVTDGRLVAEHLQRAQALQYVQGHRAALAWHDYAGVWVDGDDLVFDVVEIVAERATAVELGKRRGQDAIYDLAERQDIHTLACAQRASQEGC